MRILLIAYEFPPIIAAQSLRWFYLADGLARLGVEVHVLCPSMLAIQDFPVGFHNNVIIHRVWPGPYVHLSQWLACKTLGETVSSASKGDARHPYLLGIYRLTRKILDNILYPDLRTEWYPFAKSTIRSLFTQQNFDVVISSYEPGVDILLGLWAKKRFKMKWVIDLGDPILSPYTPTWRRKIDSWFERCTLQQADRIVVTTDRVLGLFFKRHNIIDWSKFVSIPQGFSDRQIPLTLKYYLSKDRMNIVFTGTFYRDFRNPERLATAWRSLEDPDVSLIIAGDNSSFEEIFNDMPNVKFFGKIDHFECLSLQRQADILLNIGNIQSYQLPGKLYEYLGTGKPIIHIQTGADDPAAELIKKLNAGTVVQNEITQITQCLKKQIEAYRLGKKHELSPNRDVINQYSWTNRTESYYKLLTNLQ